MNAAEKKNRREENIEILKQAKEVLRNLKNDIGSNGQNNIKASSFMALQKVKRVIELLEEVAE